MKPCILASSLLLALTAFAPIARAQISAVSPVSIRVEQVSDDKRTRFDESQKKTLKIYLTNGGNDVQNVKVKYYYFAKDVKDHEITVFKEGEKSATVKPHSTETVEAETATAQSSEKHSNGNGRYGGGGGGAGGTNNSQGGKGGVTEATGQKLVGYGAQVLVDDKVATEYFSEPSLKSNVGGGGDKAK
jgi:hypothetical protein